MHPNAAITLSVFVALAGGGLAAYLLNKFVYLPGGKWTAAGMLSALLAGVGVMITGFALGLTILGGLGLFIMQSIWCWGRFRELDILCNDGQYKDYKRRDGADS